MSESYSEWMRRLEAGEVINGLHLCPEGVGVHKVCAPEDAEQVAERLEAIRASLRAQNISYSELAELQSLTAYIESGDTELLEAAGVPEVSE